MVEETLKRYADDITLQELVRLRVENDELKERIETLQEVVRENHDTTLEIFKERERLRGLVHHAFCEGQITRVQWDDWKNSEVYAALKGDE